MTPKIFEFRGAERYIFGPGSLERIGAEAAGYGKKALLVVCSTLFEAGTHESVVQNLAQAGVASVVFQDFVAEPEPTQADQAADEARKAGCDLVIGLGGGSALDLAKAAGVLITNGGRAVDYLGVGLVPKPGVPTIMIPTTAGTGSEVTWTAVFTRRAEKAKGGINSVFLYPKLALLDPQLTLTVPPALTASTGMDALCHAIESFTSVKANPMTDLVAMEAIALIAENLPLAFADGRNLEARDNMLRGSLLAGLGLANAGVTAVHALSYPLGALFNIPHGLANAILLPHVMSFNAMGNPDKFAQVAELMGENIDDLNLREASQLAAATVQDLMVDLELEEGLSDLDIPEDSLEELAEKALGLTRVLDNNPRTLTKEDALFIYQEAF
ncbi:MAG: iron-containing alcohol dehydrogenase [Pseudomonadota bacterium]